MKAADIPSKVACTPNDVPPTEMAISRENGSIVAENTPVKNIIKGTD